MRQLIRDKVWQLIL